MVKLHKTQKTMKQLLLSNKTTVMPARLGDLQGLIKADKFNNVYITLMDGEVMTVLNQSVPNLRMYVYVGHKDNILQVLRPANSFQKRLLPNITDHDHTWGSSTNPTWVRGEQYLPGLVAPDEGVSVLFKGKACLINGSYVPVFEQVIDLSAYVPASGALFGFLEVDEDGLISVREGDAVGARELLSYDDIPTRSADKVPLDFAIKLYVGQTRVRQGLSYDQTDIIDLRDSGYGGGGDADSVEWDGVENKPDWVGNALEPATIVNGKELDSFFVDGTLAVLTDVTVSYVAQRYMKLHSILIHCKDKGSADTTIVDAHLNGTTIFTDQDKRPMLDWDATDDFAISDTPDVIELVPGDILTFDVDAIATDASSLTITLYERIVELMTIEDDIATIQTEMT